MPITLTPYAITFPYAGSQASTKVTGQGGANDGLPHPHVLVTNLNTGLPDTPALDSTFTGAKAQVQAAFVPGAQVHHRSALAPPTGQTTVVADSADATNSTPSDPTTAQLSTGTNQGTIAAGCIISNKGYVDLDIQYTAYATAPASVEVHLKLWNPLSQSYSRHVTAATVANNNAAAGQSYRGTVTLPTGGRAYYVEVTNPQNCSQVIIDAMPT